MATEVEVNPFRPGGELSKEVDDILKNSTILRDTVIINDPALRRANGTNSVYVEESTPLKSVSPLQSQPTPSPSKTQTSPNGPQHSPQSTGPITCEVTAQHVPPMQNSPTTYQANQVEHVHIKPSRKPVKCCKIQ